MVSGNLSIMYGITGPNMSLVSACATGTHSIGDAARLIKHGYVDCMIAGGAEMATAHLVLVDSLQLKHCAHLIMMIQKLRVNRGT